MPWLDDFKEKRAKERRTVHFNIALDYAVTAKDRATPNAICETNAGLTRHLLMSAFAQKFHPDGAKEPQGLKGSDRKTWGRILNRLTDAVETQDAGEESIELNEDGLDFLRKIVDAYSAPSNWCGWVATLDDALDAAHEQMKASKNGTATAKTEATKS